MVGDNIMGQDEIPDDAAEAAGYGEEDTRRTRAGRHPVVVADHAGHGQPESVKRRIGDVEQDDAEHGPRRKRSHIFRRLRLRVGLGLLIHAKTKNAEHEGGEDLKERKKLDQIQAESNLRKAKDSDQAIDCIQYGGGNAGHESMQEIALESLRDDENVHGSEGDGRQESDQ